MKYKLIENSLNDIEKPMETVLLNRGIKEWKKYINLTDECIHDVNLFKNIKPAMECFLRHAENHDKMHIIVDSDVDGYTSGSLTYRYISSYDWTIPIGYSLHTKKQHGLSSDVMWSWDEDTKLIIIPDAGSNDVEQCKEIKEKGIDIIILDHHKIEEENPYAIVVNCQDKTYPNKNISGVGVAYKFFKAIDEETWNDYADEMLDVVALGNIADVMDMREPETRYLVDLGINKIRSKAIKAFIEKQSFSMNGIVNIINIQFYIVPMLNACIRVANQEDKELLFRAFIETDEIFKYKKRGEKEETDEDIYTRAARLCANAKARQSKDVVKGVDEINKIIETQQLTKHKVLFVNVTDALSETLTGLVAIKIAEQYNRPCLLMKRQIRDTDDIFYGGSMRNFDNSPISSLREFLKSTNQFEFVQGHDNAAGVSISRNNIELAIKNCDEQLKDVDFEKVYRVDFELDASDLNIAFIKAIDDMKNLFGEGVKEPLLYIRNILIDFNELQVMGKDFDSWKNNYDDCSYVKFKVDKTKDIVLKEYGSLDLDDDSKDYSIIINAIAKVSINNYGGKLTPQVIIEDYEESR